MKRNVFKCLLTVVSVLLFSSFTADKSYYPNTIDEPECAPGFICNIEQGTEMHICVVPEWDNGTNCYDSGGDHGTDDDESKKCKFPEICLEGMICVVDNNGDELCVVPTGLNTYQIDSQTVLGKIRNWFSNLL